MTKSITNLLARLKGNIPRRWLFWTAFVLGGMVVAFCFDRLVLDLVRRANLRGLPGDLSRTLESFKEFGQFVAVVVGFLLIFTLDKPRRTKLPRLLICVLLPLLLVYPGKYLIHRVRPRHADDYNTVLGLGFFLGRNPPRPSLDSSLPNKEKITLINPLPSSEKRSFPSAHTAVAFAFAAGLSNLYPPGRFIFYSLALGCGFHRVIFAAHWFSDVVASIFIALFVARFVWRPAAKLNNASPAHKSPGESAGCASPSSEVLIVILLATILCGIV